MVAGIPEDCGVTHCVVVVKLRWGWEFAMRRRKWSKKRRGGRRERERERAKRKRNNGPSFKYLWGNSTRRLGRETNKPALSDGVLSLLEYTYWTRLAPLIASFCHVDGGSGTIGGGRWGSIEGGGRIDERWMKLKGMVEWMWSDIHVEVARRVDQNNEQFSGLQKNNRRMKIEEWKVITDW